MERTMSEPTLDREIIAELCEDYGAEILAELAGTLQAEGEAGLAALRGAAGAGDRVEAAARLHALRGAALAVGCAAVGAEAHRLERLAVTDRPPSLAEIDGLAALMATALAALVEVAETCS